jgi:hypothetical protein
VAKVTRFGIGDTSFRFRWKQLLISLASQDPHPVATNRDKGGAPLGFFLFQNTGGHADLIPSPPRSILRALLQLF